MLIRLGNRIINSDAIAVIEYSDFTQQAKPSEKMISVSLRLIDGRELVIDGEEAERLWRHFWLQTESDQAHL